MIFYNICRYLNNLLPISVAYCDHIRLTASAVTDVLWQQYAMKNGRGGGGGGGAVAGETCVQLALFLSRRDR